MENDKRIIDEIKEKYPNAQSHSCPLNPAAYCVGGACALFTDTKEPITNPGFPLSNTIAKSLQKLNTELSEEAAYTYAICIMNLNDRGHIEQAWIIAELAIGE